MVSKRSGTLSKHTQRQKKRLQPKQEAPNELALSRERIVAVAIELLDAEGISGLTMRRLADRLGSAVMSLYWHVDNKEDVFDLALDTVLQYRDPPKISGFQDWRKTIIHMLNDWRSSMLRHPWSASLLPRRALGPNILIRLELLSKILSKVGVRDKDLNVAIWSLWNHVMGATISQVSVDLSDDDRAAAQQHLSSVKKLYPTIERSRLLLDNDWDGAFLKGLDFLLDGLSSR